jgi:hypothetical protein
MGFRDRVFRNSHESVLDTMRSFQRSTIQTMEKDAQARMSSRGLPKIGWTLFGDTIIRPILFSDSVLLVSSDDTIESADHIIFSTKWLIRNCFHQGIPIKGAIAFGEQTADFENSLYFGKPLIDSYDLQNELLMYGVILHHSAERHLYDNKFLSDVENRSEIFRYKTPMIGGVITHFAVDWFRNVNEEETPEVLLSKLYRTVSGLPRKYVDNTLEFVLSVSKNENANK